MQQETILSKTQVEAREAWWIEYEAWRPYLGGLSRGARRVWDATVTASIERLAATAAVDSPRSAGYAPSLGSYACQVEGFEVARVAGVARSTVMKYWREIMIRGFGLMSRKRHGGVVSLRWPRLVAEATAQSAAAKEQEAWCKAASREENGLRLEVRPQYGKAGKYSVSCYLGEVESREAVSVLVDRLLEALWGMGCYTPKPSARWPGKRLCRSTKSCRLSKLCQSSACCSGNSSERGTNE